MSNRLLQDNNTDKHAYWVHVCPQCKPSKVMNIETIYPMTRCSSSIVTYHCTRCGYTAEMILDG